ncbi:restriction endonuclease subunit S, partial [Falsiroseomonas sp. E2-1-a4]|uniref:restriction endonuclease subunit S n=1 Tax=Falsiroseomonas sp. E2-1-a4 TaxID=3239299 RepID=UPI003F3278B0
LAASIPLPPLPEQRRIVARIEALFARTRRARADLERIAPLAEQHRRALLAAAFRGELTTGGPAKPGDPSGKENLERVRAARRKTIHDRRRREALEAIPTPSAAFPEIPSGWAWACVEEIASDIPRSIQSGPFGSALLHSEFTDTGRLVIGIDNVQDGRFSPGSQNRISDEKFAQLARFQARPQDVVITVMATVGRCCVVPADIETAIITKHVYRISVDPRLVNPHYLMNALRGCEAALEHMGANIRGQTRPGINGEILKSLFIPLPSLAEQQLIVDRLNQGLAAIEQAERQATRALALLDRLEQSILTRAFRGELVPQDPNDEPGNILLERTKAGGDAGGEKPTSGRGRKPNRSKEQLMLDKPMAARDRLLKDSEKWPTTGLPFEAIAMRNLMPHDTLRDALFELLSGPSPALQQHFDAEAEVMVIQRVAA